MMDRDKVIKALECCTKKVCLYNDTEKECPYWELCGEYEEAFEDCTTALANDALALLKAQEPVAPVQQPDGEYICGACGNGVVGCDVFDEAGIESVKNDYCPTCGRRVKW